MKLRCREGDGREEEVRLLANCRVLGKGENEIRKGRVLEERRLNGED